MSLKNLNDEELLLYYELFKKVNKRGISKKINSYDAKFLYHVVRLLLEIEQIMIEHDLDLERNIEQLKSIRRGEWTIEQIEEWAEKKERALEDVYIKSDLRNYPDENAIKELLLNCLEIHFGSLDKIIARGNKFDNFINELQKLIEKYGG